MAAPWYCGYCTTWQSAEFQLCPTCGRSGHGRVCRKGKHKVPGHALFCPTCGGDSFIEPAKVQRTLTRPQRVALGLGSLVLAGLAVWLVPPFLVWLARQALTFAILSGFYALLFLVLTACLPPTWRDPVRSGAWWCIKALIRGIWGPFKR